MEGSRLGAAEGEIDELQQTIQGLTGAMHFKGTTTTELEDEATVVPEDIYTDGATPASGDVVLYGDDEFVWNGEKWELFGKAGEFLLKSEASNIYQKKDDASAQHLELDSKITTVGEDLSALSDSLGSAALMEIADGIEDAADDDAGLATAYDVKVYVTEKVADATMVWGSF